MNTRQTTFYVQIEPEFSRYRTRNGEPEISKIKATAINQNRPQHPRSGSVVIKLTIEVPESAFMPLRPEAVIVLNEDQLMNADAITVHAEDPHE